jgi:hypothetical protein
LIDGDFEASTSVLQAGYLWRISKLLRGYRHAIKMRWWSSLNIYLYLLLTKPMVCLSLTCNCCEPWYYVSVVSPSPPVPAPGVSFAFAFAFDAIYCSFIISQPYKSRQFYVTGNNNGNPLSLIHKSIKMIICWLMNRWPQVPCIYICIISAK